MKADALRKKSDGDLKKALKENRKELQAFRFGVSGSKTRDIKTGRNQRKIIARILTELRSRHLASEDK